MALWQFGRARSSQGKGLPQRLKSRPRRKLGIAAEPLEQRLLLSISPTLVTIISDTPNEGDLITNNAVLHQAPQQLTFRFDSGQTIDASTLASGIQITRSGNDGVFGNGNDVVVATGFMGLPDKSNEVVIRFLNALPDDTYRLTVVGAGAGALKNTQGQAFNNGANSVTNFRLDLGAQVVSVVPQPVTRNGAGQLVQATNQIVVYFNSDTLNTNSAQDPTLYQLIYTNQSATNNDDVIFNPTSVVYNPANNSAVLTFAGPLSTLVPLGATGVATYRLRIGDNSTSVAAQTVNVASDAGSSFGTATQLGALGNQSKVLTGAAIDPPGSSLTNAPYNIIYPGAPTNPGQRDIPADVQQHIMVGNDATAGISTYFYNFQNVLGTDPEGNTVFNQITEAQKQRVREVFEMYGYYLGVKFVESPSSGLLIGTGDLRAIDKNIPTGPGGVAGLAGGGEAIMDNAENWGNSEFGGSYFQVAMHEIGHLLGLGHSYEEPSITIQGSAEELSATQGEPVFPGDFDIMGGQYIFRPESKDIDLYSFTLNTSGRFSAETIAERMSNSSLADTVITLYDGQGNVVARNDDYFSSDSFVDLNLKAGTYYVAVTSTGNTNFNPNVLDSGAGGTSQGPYTLRLNFVSSTPGVQMLDTTGTAIDGDSDGVPGGNYNFWFNVANDAHTIFVDKTAASAGANGTIAHPYNNMQVAIANATPGTGVGGLGSVIRVVGNGGADGNVATLGDDRAYEIGYDIFNQPLSDGATLNLPKGVTLMVDAGAIFKLRQATVNAGSFSQGIDLSAGAIQVLGTPFQKAYFTSYNNESIGVDTNPLPTTPTAGDWSGFVFRDDSDQESRGIFVNYLAFADIGYGGGSSIVDSVPQSFDPINLITARPTLYYNSIHDSANAAISADPDSFEETLFRDNTFTADYRRVGPAVHGNVLTKNSINGLFVRIRTDAGVPIDVLHVAARFNATDIVYVISENLWINGTPGGPTLNANGVTYDARLDASLVIDPAIVVKLQGARIEVGIGAQLIAEGKAGSPVVFTSLLDDSYGAGGVYDTTGDGKASAPKGGDWGGLDFDPVSKGSLDHIVLTYAGGVTPIEGTFARFNALEIRQANVRLTNSTVERNADGNDGTDRNGRGPNTSATIFIRGAQPILVDNIIRNNAGDAISINANALIDTQVVDWGRSTGNVNAFGLYNDNYGPLVRANIVTSNDVNGLIVRGATLTRGTIWDDTDIVHVLREDIDVPNFQSIGGLRLQSSPSASLVIKLSGASAGFTADGEPLDISNRIGGSVQVMGTPGHAVIMTSLSDSTVGAGFDIDGNPQLGTLGNNLPGGQVTSKLKINFNFGPNIKANPAALAAVQAAAKAWENILDDNVTLTIDFELAPQPPGVAGSTLATQLLLDYNDVRAHMIADANSNEQIVSQIPTFAQLKATLPAGVVLSNKINITRANALALGYSPSVLPTTPSSFGGTTPIDASIEFASDGAWDFDPSNGITPGNDDFVYVTMHEIGHALGFISSVDDVDFGATTVTLSPLDLFRVDPGTGPTNFTNTPRQMTPGNPAVFYDGGIFNKASLGLTPFSIGDIPMSTGSLNGDGFQASHWKFKDFLGSDVPIGLMDPVDFPGGSITSADTRAFDLIGWNAVNRGSAGDWNGITLKQYSNDRNVDVINELEPAYTGITDTNATTTQAQNIGTLATDLQNGDENRRLGMEVHGSISFDRPGDSDIYSFNAVAGTQVWFDIDKTSPSLDTVIELIDANGNVLARSNDSGAELLNPALLVGSATTTPLPLAASDFSTGDLYTINQKDAGMRLLLPGTLGTSNNYYIRVRSNSPNLNNLTGGQTSGLYQLQVRLQETDEIPGSTVRYADIRYATNGINVQGLPDASPLTTSTTRVLPIVNGGATTAQPIGNLLSSDQSMIGVSSGLTSGQDVDWYTFTVDYQQVQSLAGVSDGGKTWATMFDIDYADGLSRPDTSLYVYRLDPVTNQLLLYYIAGASNVAEDQPGAPPLNPTSQADLTKGSSGKLDPMLGTIQLQEGQQYYIAVTSSRSVPAIITSKYLHLEPVDSVRRIVEDHIGSIGFSSNGPDGKKFDPVTPAILPIADQFVPNPNQPAGLPPGIIQELSTHVKPFQLSDLGLFVSQSGGFLYVVNAATGAVIANQGILDPASPNNVEDIVIRDDGVMMGISTDTQNRDNNNGILGAIDPTTGIFYPVGSDKIPDPPAQPPIPPDALVGFQIDALAYKNFGFGDPRAGITDATYEPYNLYEAVQGLGPGGVIQSYLYQADPESGLAAITANQPWGPVGGTTSRSAIFNNSPGDLGITRGMAYVHTQGIEVFVPSGSAIINGQFFSISDIGHTVTYQFVKVGSPPAPAGRIGISYTGSETQLAMQNLVINAFNNTPGLGVKAAIDPNGDLLVLNAFGFNSGNSPVFGTGLPNGGYQLFGVSTSGKFFTIDDTGNSKINGSIATLIKDFGPSAPFTGLAIGPQNLDLNGDGIGGDLKDTLFAVTSNGDLYAILYDPLTGTATLRTDVFPGGADHISTLIGGASGLAFSPVDYNLWHPTNQSSGDAGHGAISKVDNAGGAVGGGTSFYFGQENWAPAVTTPDIYANGAYRRYSQISQYGIGNQNSQFGNILEQQQLDMTYNAYRLNLFGPNATGLSLAYSTAFSASAILRKNQLLGNNYNAPGGVHGDLITSPFSLQGYDYSDRPTLYFNYYAETAASLDGMSLSLSADGGKTWIPTGAAFTSEIRAADGTIDPVWRQARVDLSGFVQAALQNNVPLNNIQIEFSFTANTKDNNYKGWSIDDIIVGFAERGEMVTTVQDSKLEPQDGSFVYLGPPPPGSTQSVQSGPYQLQIRRGEEYAVSTGGLKSDIQIQRQFDTNDRLFQGFSLQMMGAFALEASASAALADGQTFTVFDGVNTRTFEFDDSNNPNTLVRGVVAGHIGIPLIAGENAGAVARRIMLAINQNTSLTFGVTATLDVTGTKVYMANAQDVNPDLAPALKYKAQLLDGQTFTVNDGVHSRTFEFDNNGSVTAGNVGITFVKTDQPRDMAVKALNAVNGQYHPVNFLTSAALSPRADRLDLFTAAWVFATQTPQLTVLRFDNNGDKSLWRPQGEIILQGNRISNSATAGIIVQPAVRTDLLSHAGAAAVLANVNTPRLAPGVVIMNNVIDTFGSAGIAFSGDPNGPGLPNAVVPFGRIVNNTIYGAGTGTGIAVGNNASPTLLNNILAFLTTGVAVDATSGTTVLGGNLFQGNGTNTVGTGLGSFAITPQSTAPLFVNAAQHNFNLLKSNATGLPNQAIDSSLNTLQDRQAMITVDSPIGITVSPIIAPTTDLTGNVRVDDPSVNPPFSGLGSNVFKDRGALDRSDFTGPTSSLLNPVDNDASGNDQDPSLNNVVLVGQTLSDFRIQLKDGAGTGIDDSTVSAASFTLTRNGVPLVLGVDYTFSYDATNDVAKFTPVVGIWQSNFVYTITVDNTLATGIKDLAGNALLPTDLTGVTKFTIGLVPVDFGDAPSPYPTTFLNNGARHILSNGLFLGSTVTSEPNGQPSADANADTGDDGVVFNSVIMPGTTATITVTASQAGKLDAFIDWNGNGDWSDAGDQIFASQSLVAGANILQFSVPSTVTTATFARFRVSTAGGLASTGLAPDGEVEDYKVAIVPPVEYTTKLYNAATGKELPKDATGEYVALAGTTIQARVYVNDLRSVGATGGVFSAFADLTRDTAGVTWGSLVVSSNFPNAQSGSIDGVNQIVDEAGGLGGISPTGAGTPRLLFTVNGALAQALTPGTVINVTPDPADQVLAHQTTIYGSPDPVSASYVGAKMIIPVHPWQNPANNLDVDGSGVVVPLDALLVINALNQGLGGALPQSPVPPNIPPPYLDVNGDGNLTPIDALLVISFLNQQPPLVAGGAPPAAQLSATAGGAPPAPQAAPAVNSTTEQAPVVASSALLSAAPVDTGTSSTATSFVTTSTSATPAGFASFLSSTSSVVAPTAAVSTGATVSVAQAAASSGETTRVDRSHSAPESNGASGGASGTLQERILAQLFGGNDEEDALELADVGPRLENAWNQAKNKWRHG